MRPFSCPPKALPEPKGPPNANHSQRLPNTGSAIRDKLMKRAYATIALLVLTLGLVVAGCGSGSDEVPSNAVAVVDGTEIPRSELDELVAQAKAGYTAADREFPKVGTPEYQSIQQQYVASLIQKVEFEREADERGITISDADVDKARDDLIKSRLGGDEKKLTAALAEQGYTEESLRSLLRVSVLSQKLFESVTKDVTVADADALAYYTQNQELYGTPESRDVRHILIAEKDANGQVDFAKSKVEAERLYAELQDGADFAALAKEYSADTASKASGGKYTANRGQSVPEFDKAAFDLDTNEVSQPVRTQYGYHLIEPLADAKPAVVTPFEKVKAAIKASLLQTKRNQVMTDWLQDLQKRYEGKITYAAGLAPPDLPDATTETQ
jgi:foldase protein PrsA